MYYENLEEEYDATVDEMINVAIERGDEVLFVDDNETVFAGTVIGIDCYSDRFTPPTYTFIIEQSDGVIKGIEEDYIIKRREKCKENK